MLRLRRATATASCFLLPLGFLGIPAVALLALFGISRWRRVRSKVVTTLPYTMLAATTAALVPLAQGSSGMPFARSIGAAILYVLGPSVAIAVVEETGVEFTKAVLVLGAAVLAASVVGDAVLHWHAIPVGLFMHDELHNWAGFVLAASVPLSITGSKLLGGRLSRIILTAVVLAGLLASESWVAIASLFLAVLIDATVRRHWRTHLVLVPAALLLAAGGRALAVETGFHDPVRLLTRLIIHRIQIIYAGLHLAGQRPLLGWFPPYHDVFRIANAFTRQTSLSFVYSADHTLSHFHNLLVQTAFSYGVFGVLGLLILAGWLLGLSGRPMNQTYTISVLAFLLCQILDISWYYTPSLVFALLVASLGRVAPDSTAQGGPDGFTH